MSLTKPGKMMVAGHRGDCYNYFENTMKSFQMSALAGADMIETDVQLTKDNEIIIMHDTTVDRTTDGKGRISEKTLDEMKKLNAGNSRIYERVPTFSEFIKWASNENIMLNIEIKEYYSKENEKRCIKCIEGVIDLIEKYNLRDKTVINSFDAWVLEYVYKKYGKRYLLHGFYPYYELRNVTINPDEYLYCACVFEIHKKEHFDYLISKNIEPWIGAGVTQKENLKMCCEYGARLVTTNFTADTINKLKELGKRDE
jgi:glycerophosphoryl diester phosphodiesterase